MKTFLVFLLTLFLLSGCAGRTGTPSLAAPVSNTPTNLPVNATIMPSLDVSELPEKFPGAMKGFELVSWQKDGVWWYTLVTGTNRQKSFEELTSPQSWIIPNVYLKVTTDSLVDLKSILQRLPSGSEVIWGGMELSGEVEKDIPYFTYPPVEILAELTSICEKYEIQLTTLTDVE